MRFPLIALALCVLAFVVGCTRQMQPQTVLTQSEIQQLESDALRVQMDNEQRIDYAIEPWLIRPAANFRTVDRFEDAETTLIQFKEPLDFSDSKSSHIEPKPDPEPDKVAYSDPRLDEVLEVVREIRREMADKDDVKAIRSDIAKLKEVIVKYQTSDGAVKTASTPIDENGKGTIDDLPPGSTIVAVNGVPLASPQVVKSTVSNGSTGGVSYGGSTGGSVSQYTQPPTDYYSAPVTSTVIDSPLSTTTVYQSPGQFAARTRQTPRRTTFEIQTSSQCYTDANGNMVCPNQRTSTTTTRAAGRGVLGRLFGR
jgi:hypothetical protein